MASQDDPEARIRELERSLNDQARSSELGPSSSELGGGGYGYVNPPPAPPPGSYPPPPPPPGSYGQTYAPPPPPPGSYENYGSYGSFSPQAAPGNVFPTVRSSSSGFGVRAIVLVVFAVVGIGIAGAVFAIYQTTRAVSDFSTNFPSINVPSVSSGSSGSSQSTATAAAPVTVSGMGEHRTVICDGGAVTISGMSNTVEITGNCTKLTVSGVQNQITIDSADAIDASGVKNKVTYHSGAPDVQNFGSDNSVEQG